MCNLCRTLRPVFSPDDHVSTGDSSRFAATPGDVPETSRPSVKLAGDWRRPHVLVARLLVRAYRLTFSAFMGRTCRYFPSCSEYTEEAIGRFGLWAGFWIGLSRIARCHPWGANGWDPIPGDLPRDSRWYMPWRYGRWTGAHITKRL